MFTHFDQITILLELYLRKYLKEAKKGCMREDGSGSPVYHKKKLEGREMSGLGKCQPISSMDSYHTATEKSPYEDNAAS